MSESGLIIALFTVLFTLFVVLTERKLLAYAMRRMGPTLMGRNGAFQIALDLFKSENRIMYTTPLLVKANCFQTTSGTDTDIQNVYNSVSFTSNEEWDKFEFNYLANKILQSYTNKDKSGIAYLYTRGIESTPYLTRTLVKTNNIKSALTIVLTKTPEISQMLEYVCVYPLSEKENIKSLINLQPIKYYYTNNYVYCVPDKFVDNIINDKVWDDSYLNVSCPF